MRLGIQAAIARELNITARHINDILAGRKRAGSKLAVRLEQLTGIDRAIWVWGTPEEIKKSLDEIYSGPLDRAQKKEVMKVGKVRKEVSMKDRMPFPMKMNGGKCWVCSRPSAEGAMNTLTRP